MMENNLNKHDEGCSWEWFLNTNPDYFLRQLNCRTVLELDSLNHQFHVFLSFQSIFDSRRTLDIIKHSRYINYFSIPPPQGGIIFPFLFFTGYSKLTESVRNATRATRPQNLFRHSSRLSCL